MDVHVINVLMGNSTVILEDIVAGTLWRIDIKIESLNKLLGHRQQVCQIFIRHIVQFSSMAFWNNEDMALCSWLNVQERVTVLCLVDFERWYFAF